MKSLCRSNKSVYATLHGFCVLFLLLSFIVRTALLTLSWAKVDPTFGKLFSIYTKGFLFDAGVIAFFAIPYSLYLLCVPARWNKTTTNKIITYAGFFLTVMIIMFAFFAEFTFWDEFECRFNFIAVDYLIYTFEVVNNINQSYPLHYLISGMLLLCIFITWLFVKRNIFKHTFEAQTPLRVKIVFTIILLLISSFYLLFINNSWAEKNVNRYQNELSKAGIYSFFAAFKNNELDYNDFYQLRNREECYAELRQLLLQPGAHYMAEGNNIYRSIIGNNQRTDSEYHPNIIMVTIESFSADFMQRFGNTKNLTPHIDALAKQGILFSDMYATGTRTVRGMEALTLAVPPSPGSSIVRRQDNANLFSVSTILKNKGYDCSFFYGGDGYFDNMNKFFGSNAFDIIDRGRKALQDGITTKRTIIEDHEVKFENAWGICDEDIYNAVIKNADAKHSAGKPFFDFVMTTSNHQPYTYPEGKIDIPSGSGRDGTVKYTDYAIGQFIANAKKKPWFNNTVFVFVADHCASSAGKNEIDISKYHIPAIVYNLKNAEQGKEISPLCSQIDLYPTLFGMMQWNYESNWYGQDVLSASYAPRAFVGTYQKLGYIKSDTLVILSPQQQVSCYVWNKKNYEQKAVTMNNNLLQQAIAYYQTAYDMYKNGGMKAR